MSVGPKFYLTTPLYYVNARPHVGSAFEIIGIDCMARFKRFLGYDVFLLTGTDEHGKKIALAAEAEGIEPQTFTDKMVDEF